jgi:hypothetical protein
VLSVADYLNCYMLIHVTISQSFECLGCFHDLPVSKDVMGIFSLFIPRGDQVVSRVAFYIISCICGFPNDLKGPS